MTDGDWWKIKGGVKPHGGKFKPIERWLGYGRRQEAFRPGLAARPARRRSAS